MNKSIKKAPSLSPTEAAIKFILTFCVVVIDNSDIFHILAYNERNRLYKTKQRKMARV